MIPHGEDAVRVTQHVANYFISEARKSSNKPHADKVLDNLIYYYSPTYCGRVGRGYDEVYICNYPHRTPSSRRTVGGRFEVTSGARRRGTAEENNYQNNTD